MNIARRTEELFSAHQRNINGRTDRLFMGLMLFQWLGSIAAAFWISPKTWSGPMSQTHIHVWAAVFLGGAITLLPVLLALKRPGQTPTRHVIAAGQALMSALLIHLMGGRIETHFHVFGSLAFLAFYRDWRVLITASVIVAADHLLRGFYWPQSVYGVLSVSNWRWAEHAAWVVYEDVFLVRSCLQSIQEMRDIAWHRARLEDTNRTIQEEIGRRTAELSSSEKRFRVLVENAADAFFLADAEGRFIDMNRRACELLGYTREELLGMTVMDISPGFSRAILEQLAVTLSFQGQALREGKHRRKDGTTFPTEVSLGLADHDGRQCFIALVRDISERRKMEARMQQSEKLSAVGQLAAGVAHEINNPLGVILGFSQGMSRQVKAGDALRCKTLVQNLLTFARTSQSDRGVISLNETIQQAMALVETQVKLTSVSLQVGLAKGLPMVLGNKNQLQQVVLNLAKNAIDAMPNGGTLSIATELLESKPHSWICLKVADTGTGIPSALLQKIFEPFFTTKPVGQGTGLGLSLISEIVQKHSGTLDVTSRPGATVFTVKLPVRTGREMEECLRALETQKPAMASVVPYHKV
ncbi:MAG: PAS domain S-box protein [Elusimicrobia bacterium]|nr:PAS domain S-box protein [Elusimicrobiota bacterium]